MDDTDDNPRSVRDEERRRALEEHDITDFS